MVIKSMKSGLADRTFMFFNYLLLAFVAFTTAYPFLTVIVKSLTTFKVDAISGAKRTILDIGAYSYILKNESIYSSFLLTILVVVISTVLHLLITVLIAYPLSKKKLKGRIVILVYVVLTMVFSGGLIPYYLLIRDLGLRNNPAVYVVVGLVSGFNIIIAKNFFSSIPQSLEESAKMDGASDFTVLFKIVLPTSKPIISTLALWFAVGKWNDWMTGLLFMSKGKFLIIQNVLRDMLIQNTGMGNMLGLAQSDKFMLMDNVKMAVVVVATLPIICVYPFVQKYFIKGILLGSIKE
jgi:putative aldouronate transport system permease protein